MQKSMGSSAPLWNERSLKLLISPIAADRAIALNPMDATTMAFLGSFIAYSGDWERGCALAEKGMDLNPNHPGWFRFTSYFKEFAKQDYRAALDLSLIH